MVRIRRSHRRGPGSIPGQGNTCFLTWESLLPALLLLFRVTDFSPTMVVTDFFFSIIKIQFVSFLILLNLRLKIHHTF